MDIGYGHLKQYDKFGLLFVQKNFGAYLAIASNVPNALFVMLNAAFGQRFPFVRRVLVSSSIVIVLFVVVTILGRIQSTAHLHFNKTWNTLLI